MKALGPTPHFPKRVVVDRLEASAKLPLAAKDRKHDEISEFEDGDEYMGEEDQDIDHAKSLVSFTPTECRLIVVGRVLSLVVFNRFWRCTKVYKTPEERILHLEPSLSL
jgi:hypothetical protein